MVWMVWMWFPIALGAVQDQSPHRKQETRRTRQATQARQGQAKAFTPPDPSSPPPKTLSPRSPIDPALLFVTVTDYLLLY